jgi:pyruvate/2-oxoglutarate dehydrogenase complex dihydrolipoamide acyltransferase (E2) component
MPGTVIAVSASPGEAVRLGQVIMVVEAMKMEHSLRAPFDGIVVDLLARAGQQVKLDELLARLDPDPGSPGWVLQPFCTRRRTWPATWTGNYRG